MIDRRCCLCAPLLKDQVKSLQVFQHERTLNVLCEHVGRVLNPSDLLKAKVARSETDLHPRICRREVPGISEPSPAA